jgi:hypothetical protein
VRILTVGIDLDLLTTRQAVLMSRGYDSLIATPEDFDEKLQSGSVRPCHSFSETEPGGEA